MSFCFILFFVLFCFVFWYGAYQPLANPTFKDLDTPTPGPPSLGVLGGLAGVEGGPAGAEEDTERGARVRERERKRERETGLKGGLRKAGWC